MNRQLVNVQFKFPRAVLRDVLTVAVKVDGVGWVKAGEVESNGDGVHTLIVYKPQRALIDDIAIRDALARALSFNSDGAPLHPTVFPAALAVLQGHVDGPSASALVQLAFELRKQ